MAPLLKTSFSSLNSSGTIEHNDMTSIIFRDQLRNPSDVFSVLLILGGDIIGKALAQLTGDGLAPVAFSFGWVGYSVSALISAVGDNKLMPINPDCRCKVINGRSGHVIENTSWVLSRIVRDYDKWMNKTTRAKLSDLMDRKWKELKLKDSTAEKPFRSGLVIAVYEPDTDHAAKTVERDYVYWSGICTSILQLGIAVIPYAVFGDWGILLVTIAGMVLTASFGFLPQWQREKWPCRTNSNDVYLLTRGNGSQHAIAILDNGHGLNLEDMATGQANNDSSQNLLTRTFVTGFCFLWIVLLIMASGLDNNTWFLLAVGAVGMLQNVLVAASARRPQAYGIHLRFKETFGETKVMKTLMHIEGKYPRLGSSMLAEFFPAGLRENEKAFWEAARSKADQSGDEYSRPVDSATASAPASSTQCPLPASTTCSDEGLSATRNPGQQFGAEVNH